MFTWHWNCKRGRTKSKAWRERNQQKERDRKDEEERGEEGYGDGGKERDEAGEWKGMKMKREIKRER